jgi:hypothetical protein
MYMTRALCRSEKHKDAEKREVVTRYLEAEEGISDASLNAPIIGSRCSRVDKSKGSSRSIAVN